MKKKETIALAIGETFKKMGQLNHMLAEKYANKCDAYFVYEKIVFINTSIAVIPTAPDLLKIVPCNTFGATNEEDYSMASSHKQITQDQYYPYQYFFLVSSQSVLDSARADIKNLNTSSLSQANYE